MDLKKRIQILASSDTHGRFTTWDYALNKEDYAGSMVQMKTAISQLREEPCILIDAGDVIQGNSSELFIDEDIHPMIIAQNDIGYDLCVVGNHDFNFTTDTLRRIISQRNSLTLVGNVFDVNGNPLADGYTIVVKEGVRIGVIGMVTPNITRWDAKNLQGWKVTDPANETRRIIDAIINKVDILIGVFHMDIENEYGVKNSGVRDLAFTCPELDLIIASHGHQRIEGQEINGVKIIENAANATTVAEIMITLQKRECDWEVIDLKSELHNTAIYAADAALNEKLKYYHGRAIRDAEIVIGRLEGDDLAPPNEISGVPISQMKSTALVDLQHFVQLHYTGATVSAAKILDGISNLYAGPIRKSDTSLIYKYSNTLYKLQITGAQLRKFMEWSAEYYNTWQDGDLTISFNNERPLYLNYMFAGVYYDINVSKEPGCRIENLVWPNGMPVKDNDCFSMAVDDYGANSLLLNPGDVFKDGDPLPMLLEMDVRGDIGGIRELIAAYIKDIKKGRITAESLNNWHLTGYEWDTEMHDKLVELVNSGIIVPEESSNGRTPNVKAIREEDIADFL